MKAGKKPPQIGNSCLTIKTKKIMKKNLFMVVAVALMALVSCSKENFNDNGVQGEASDIVFSAELEQPAGEPAAQPSEIQSKTSLGAMSGNNRPVSWVKGDQIKINGVTFTAASAGSRTDFTPTGSFNTAATYYAVYPASATSKTDHSAITIPASQDGSFAKAAISVAKSTTTSLSFKNVASIIKFQVYGDFKGNVKISSDQNIAGTVSVTFDEKGNPVLGEVQNPSKEITINGTFTSNGIYYVAVLPGSHKFTVKYEDFVSKVAKSSVSANRSNIVNLQKFPEPNLLYLVPNSNWKQADARFAGYFYNSDTDNKWVDLSAYNQVYACEKQTDYKTVIFCRMNPSQKDNKWENKWDQTGNLTIGSEKYCVIPFDVWGGLTQWSESKTFSTKNKVFLAPGDNWREANARFEAYFWGVEDQWVTMSLLSDNPVYYVAEYKQGQTGMKFLRKDPNSPEHNWDSGIWAQTGNLTVNEGKFWTTTGWGGEGSWTSK